MASQTPSSAVPLEAESRPQYLVGMFPFILVLLMLMWLYIMFSLVKSLPKYHSFFMIVWFLLIEEFSYTPFLHAKNHGWMVSGWASRRHQLGRRQSVMVWDLGGSELSVLSGGSATWLILIQWKGTKEVAVQVHWGFVVRYRWDLSWLKGIRDWLRCEWKMSCYQIHAFRDVCAVLASKASKKRPHCSQLSLLGQQR